MPLGHFLDERSRHVIHVERATFLGDDRVEEHLQQHVAELGFHRVVVAAPKGVVELVRLLVQVGAERLVRLRLVPRVARAQVAHDGEGVVEGALGGAV